MILPAFISTKILIHLDKEKEYTVEYLIDTAGFVVINNLIILTILYFTEDRGLLIDASLFDIGFAFKYLVVHIILSFLSAFIFYFFKKNIDVSISVQ